MQWLILGTLLLIVTACASDESGQRTVRSDMPQTMSPGLTSSAVVPQPSTPLAVPSTTVQPSAQTSSASMPREEPLTSQPALSAPPRSPLEPAAGSSGVASPPGATVTKRERDREPPAVSLPTGPTITFFDTSSFDKQLSATLRRGPEATVVTFEATSSVNDIPQRLNKWLSAVDKYEGKVQLQLDPDYPVIAQRELVFGAASFVLGAFVTLYQAIVDKILYSPAKGYDATVYYIKGSGVMTKVVFTRKPPQS